MSAFPIYERYKDSGVEWLGEIPEHWEVEKARYIFQKEERPPENGQEVVTAYRDGQVTLRSLRRNEGYTMAIIEHGYQSVIEGDLVIHGMDAFAGAIGVAEANGKCTPEYSVLTPKRDGINPHWYAHLLRLMAHRGYIHIICPSVRERAPRFRFPKLQDNFLPIPPKPEQDRIVTFLDRKTAEIDALIAKKQRQIELLDEQKAILINRAVTRGLNPNAKLKPSGIEWIGEIPEHWRSGNIRRFAQMKTGHTPSRSVPAYWRECVIPWFTLADVWQLRDGRRMFLEETKERISHVGLANSAADLLPKGSVCFSRTASVGFSGIMPEPMATTQDFWNWICGGDVLPKFLLFVFRGMSVEFRRLTMGSTHKTIYKADAAGLVIPVPPIAEQEEIVSAILERTDVIHSTMDSVSTQIENLRSLRSTLITHAVTGRIKV